MPRKTSSELTETSSFRVALSPSSLRTTQQRHRAGRDVIPKRHHKLGAWLATGICGNDITSSCLYVAAIATTYAGALSPLVLLMVGGLLYLFRFIYAEVGEALPLNGGAYNALLNTTTKFKASVAACMTFLSYLATACISAKTAIEYATPLIPSEINIVMWTIGLLGLFAALAIMGITESAKVALAIFVFHILTLITLVGLGLFHILTTPEVLMQNWALPSPTDWKTAVFLGFSAALLGISGFESSANYIEEQKDGVFPKTLKNMWVAVTFFNPIIALVALATLPLASIMGNKESLLVDVAGVLGGKFLGLWISVDAVLVLSGAVLTSYVGSSGLVRRMALDRCLPQFLLRSNRRGSQHFIILTFFVLCSSILFVTKGDLLSLGGVYTISFLGVMSLFAIGNGLMKVRRGRLPRSQKAKWTTIFVALVATLAGIAGNIAIKREYLDYWSLYFFPTMLLVAIMLYRHHLLKLTLLVLRDMRIPWLSNPNNAFSRWVQRALRELESHGIIFFTKGDDAANLNRAMLYVRANEITDHITVIHVYEKEENIPARLESDLRFLDVIYPELDIELVKINGRFSPELINQLSNEFSVPKNYMFLGAPSAKFPYNIGDLGGVRLII